MMLNRVGHMYVVCWTHTVGSDQTAMLSWAAFTLQGKVDQNGFLTTPDLMDFSFCDILQFPFSFFALNSPNGNKDIFYSIIL